MYENPFITRIDFKVLFLLSCSYGYQDRHFKRAEYNISGMVHRIPMPVCITFVKMDRIWKILFSRHISKPNRVHMMKTFRLKQRFRLIFFLSFPYFVTQLFFLFSGQNSRTRSLRQNIFSIIVKLYEEAVTEKTPQTRVVILADTSSTKFEFVLVSSDSRTSGGGGSEEKGLILIDELLTPDWPASRGIRTLTSPSWIAYEKSLGHLHRDCPVSY